MTGMGTGMNPPGTGMRGMGMNPPGTAMRGMTGARGATRQGTAAQQPVLGFGALTDVKITDRPTTMQGMVGMKTGSVGPKRQIYDKSYYMGELRKRCTDLTNELTKINNDINQVQQDNSLYA